MKMLALVLGIIFLVLAVLTATGMAAFLPALGVDGHHHVKHAVLFVVIAVLCFVWMRFASNAQA